MSATHLDEVISELLKDLNTCYVGTVIHFVKVHKTKCHIFKGKKKSVPYTTIADQIIDNFSRDKDCVDHQKIIHRIRSLFNEYTNLTKSIERNWDRIVAFLRQEFEFPLLTFVKENTPPRSCEQPSGPLSAVLTPVKTRHDCDNCSSAKKVNVSFQKKLRSQSRQFFKLRKTAAELKREWKVRSKNQKLKRLEERIGHLKSSVRNSEIKIRYLSKRNAKLADSLNVMSKEDTLLKLEIAKLKIDLETLRNSLKEKDSDINGLLRQNDNLICTIKDLESTTSSSDRVSGKEGKCYNSAVRQCVYYQLISDVPVSNCGFVLKTIVEVIGGKSLDCVPSRSTCAQMAYELGVVSTLHLMEFMLEQKSLCLSWDATSIAGAHVNEIHLTANKVQCLVLDVRHLPGGTNSDYSSHIVSALTDAAAVHSRFSARPEEEVLSSLLSLIKSTLTDRAAVNAVVTRQLCCELEADLLQLNCNVHPLDSIAREVKKDLAMFDVQHGVQGHCYGTEGVAANLIKAVSVLRHKDGKGDPVGFMNFLRQNDIPLGAFPRYVGNRLHVLFHLAGIIIQYAAKLTEFVESQCTAAGLLRSKLLKDLKDPKIMAQVWALAVLGKMMTGPWMSKFYSSAMSNLEMGPLVRCCATQLEAWINDPAATLNPSHDVFGEELRESSDEVLSCVVSYETSETEVQFGAVECILRSSLKVVLRQMGAFINGVFAHPTADMMEQAASAPTHNMASERALGSLDRMWRRAPNATMGFLNGKVRSKLNRTMGWLEAKTVEERDNIIRFAIKEGQSDRARKSLEQKSVFTDIADRRVAVSKKRDASRKRSVVKSLKDSFSAGTVVNTEGLADVAVRKLTQYFKSPESVIGTLVLHTIDGVQKYARIHNVKKRHIFKISYWDLEEPESSCVDFSVSATSFYADVALGFVIFM